MTLIALAVAGLAWFLLVERRAAEPMLPLHVFKIRNFSVTMVTTAFVGLGLFGAMTFLPFYQQTIQGASPTVSGLLMTPMMVGSMVTSMLAGTLTTKTGKYRVFPIVGGILMTAGMFLLSTIGVDTSRLTTGIYYVVLGLGMGCLMQMMSVIAQNSVELKDMGVATSARMFFQQMGGSLGVAAFGAIFAHKLDRVDEQHRGGRQGAHQWRVARPDAGDEAAGAGQRRWCSTASPRRCTPSSSGRSRPRVGLPARPVHQGSAAARPGRPRRGVGPGTGGRGADRLVTRSGSHQACLKGAGCWRDTGTESAGAARYNGGFRHRARPRRTSADIGGRAVVPPEGLKAPA